MSLEFSKKHKRKWRRRRKNRTECGGIICVKLHMAQHSQNCKNSKVSLKFHSIPHTIWCFTSLLFHDVFDGPPQMIKYSTKKKNDGQLLHPSRQSNRRNFPTDEKFFWAEIFTNYLERMTALESQPSLIIITLYASGPYFF